MHIVWRNRLLTYLARWSFRHRRIVLGICALSAVACIVLTALGLGFQSDRNALVSEHLDWNQRFLQWRADFDLGGDLVVVADAANPDGIITPESRRRARHAMDQLGIALQNEPAIGEVWWRLFPEDLGPRLLRIAPPEIFETTLTTIESAVEAMAITDITEGLPASLTPNNPEQLTQLASVIDTLTAFYRAPSDSSGLLDDLLTRAASGEPRYLATDNQRLLLMTVRPTRQSQAIEPFEQAIRIIRTHINHLRDQDPQLQLGLTGIETVESDETAAAVRDATLTSSVAAVLILTLLIIAYRGIIIPLALATPLILAMAWSFGFTTLAIGHLQLISVVFMAILLGLGADFGVHLIASLMRRLPAGRDISESRYEKAVISAYRGAGPGLVTGALTTALAFGTTLLTDFTGVAEMGLIAAAGVLFALLATFLALPGLLWYCRNHLASLSTHRSGRAPQNPNHADAPPRKWWPLLAVLLVTLLATVYTARHLRFDDDLLRLLPRNVESVDWQQRIVRDGGRTLWYGVIIRDSLDQAHATIKTLRADTSGLIGELGGIALLYPPDAVSRRSRLETLHGQLRKLPANRDILPEDTRSAYTWITDQVQTAGNLAALTALTRDEAWTTELQEAAGRWSRLQDELSDQQRIAATEALRQTLMELRATIYTQLIAATDPSPIDPSEIPELLRASFVSDTQPQKYAIEVYPSLPEGVSNALDPHFLPQFVERLRTYDAQATGVMLQVYESGRLIRRSYLFAGALAFIVVLVVVAIDLRSLRDAALALFPVVIGMVFGGAILAFFNEPVTPASIIGLPLLFGVGVDSGVHLLHRFHLHPRVDWPGLTDGTGWSISLTGTLTLIGFGSLLLAQHRGMSGLGLVMALGIALTLLACLTVVPMTLSRISHRRHDRRALKKA